jgi:hypothetical protein
MTPMHALELAHRHQRQLAADLAVHRKRRTTKPPPPPRTFA